MDLLSNYYSLLPNINQFFFCSIPCISYFVSVKIYKKFHKEKKITDEKYIRSSTKHMISSIPSIIFFGFPFFNYYSVIYGFNFYNIIFGVLLTDTIQYFLHYFLHESTFLYKYHIIHHKPIPISPESSFSNNDVEINIVSPIQLLIYMLAGLSFIEFIIVISLSFVATVSDHTVTSKRKFHYIHHHVTKNKNLQQPFFTFWDHIFGTYHKGSELKIPFKP
jgi:sterol desaturase/sphingolipid hydroxylase (fatty acid hydroxylase superfamily)